MKSSFPKCDKRYSTQKKGFQMSIPSLYTVFWRIAFHICTLYVYIYIFMKSSSYMYIYVYIYIFIKSSSPKHDL